jgi:hypothetical protein
MTPKTFAEIEINKRYFIRLDPIKHADEIINDEMDECMDIFVLAKEEKELWGILSYARLLKEYPEDMEKIKALTPENIQSGAAFDISEILEDEIVVYDYFIF